VRCPRTSDVLTHRAPRGAPILSAHARRRPVLHGHVASVLDARPQGDWCPVSVELGHDQVLTCDGSGG
jgi:hypothetical protein